MDPLTLSRFQFGDTAAFHILWPLLSIGLSLFMFVLEAAWLYTKDERYFRQVKFWAKIFILTFGIGTASGIPLEFEFGTNWATFSAAAGDFFGNILGFESTVAFALEAAFLGIFIFGWKRVRPSVHLFSNGMVALGATLSAFWIMVANSWMQVPVGVTVQGGKIVVTDYLLAIFNPDSIVSFLHMEVACIETTLFFIAGLCAWALLVAARSPASSEGALSHDGATTEDFPSRKNPYPYEGAGVRARRQEFFLQAFKWSLALAILITPLQIFLGDLSGTTVARLQPAKVAAFELHWQTNAPGQGAAWSLVAWPSPQGGSNSFDIAIPDALSILTTHSLTGQVEGLNSFAPDNRPSLVDDTIVFYSFRVMVAIGFALFFLMALGAWYWWKGKLTPAAALRHRIFWLLWVLAMPLGFIATESGWMVREIGRQPWVVYHLMRTADAVSPGLNTPEVATTTALFTLIYLAFSALFIYFTYRFMKNGPDFDEQVPAL